MRVGLVGGLGPESTIDYYRRILIAWERVAPGSSPAIVIDSLDVQVGLRLVAQDRGALADYLHKSIVRLANADADFVAITANTGHVVFDEIAKRSPVPLLSIVDPCVAEASRLGLRRLLLLGTRFTMEASFYPTTCARNGIEVVVPNEDERSWIHARYVGELLKGDFRDETRAAFVDLITERRKSHNVDGVILAGTELPLLLRQTEVASLPVLDTTSLHVQAIVARLQIPAS